MVTEYDAQNKCYIALTRNHYLNAFDIDSLKVLLNRVYTFHAAENFIGSAVFGFDVSIEISCVWNKISVRYGAKTFVSILCFERAHFPQL